jgi:hypothetical protein
MSLGGKELNLVDNNGKKGIRMPTEGLMCGLKRQ